MHSAPLITPHHTTLPWSVSACSSLFSPSSEDLPTPPPDQTEPSCVPRITSLLSSSSWSGSSLQASLSKTATGQVLCLPDYRPQRGGLGGGVQRVRACVRVCACCEVDVFVSLFLLRLNTSAEYFAMVVDAIATLLEVGVV